VLPTLPAASADSIITDPPYGATEADKTKVMGIYAGGVWPEFGHTWDTVQPVDWLGEAFRVLKPGAALVAFTDNTKVSVLWDAMAVAGLKPLRCLYWHKTNPPTNPRKNFVSAVEVAVFGRKPGKVLHWAGGGASHNYFRCAKVAGVHKIHPTQKPLQLMEWLLLLVTPPGGTVLDPFMGGGTTGVGAAHLGMQFIGIENDKDAYGKATHRLANVDQEKGKCIAH
jgi:site-specific DNA-methyltransferase (adenine-specific)